MAFGEQRMPRGPAAGHGLTGSFEDPLDEISRTIEEFATEPAAAEARLQPQKYTLRDVLTGHTG
jgi:hypothetical protein